MGTDYHPQDVVSGISMQPLVGRLHNGQPILQNLGYTTEWDLVLLIPQH